MKKQTSVRVVGKTQSFAHISTQKNTTSPQSLLKTILQSKSIKKRKKKVTRNFEFMARLLKFKLLSVFVMRCEALDIIMHPQWHFLSSWTLLRQHYTPHTHSNTYAHQRKEMWHLKRATACKKLSAGEWRNNATLPRSIVSRFEKRGTIASFVQAEQRRVLTEQKFRGGQLRISWQCYCSDKITAAHRRAVAWRRVMRNKYLPSLKARQQPL